MLTSRVATTFSGTVCVIAGVHFDGNTALTISSLIANAADTTTAVSFWAKTQRFPDASQLYEFAISNPDTTGSTVPNFSFYQIDTFGVTGSPCQVVQQWSPVTQFSIFGMNWPTDEDNNGDHLGGNDTQWRHFLIQMNSSGSNRPGAMLVNGLDYAYNHGYAQGQLGADSTNGLADLPFWIGGSGMGTDTDGNYLVGDLAEFWLQSGTDLLEVDGTFSDATIAKFIGPGNRPVFLGDTGQLPTGTQATIYCHRCADEDASAFLVNRGSGGTITTFSGAITASATNPAGGEPKPLGVFAIAGSTVVGATISISGSWTNSPTSVTYQWWSSNSGTVIATTSTYVLQPGDLGDFLWAVIVATNASGSTFVDTSIGTTDNNIYFGPITSTPADTRVTSGGDSRVTSTGDTRVTA